MITRLTLICHAPTSATRAARVPQDEPLEHPSSDTLAALGGTLGRVDAAWAGPSQRTRQTAAGLGLDAGVETALAELDLGQWAGRALADIAAETPDAMARWMADPASAPHGGETLVALAGRVAGWLDGVQAQGGRVVAVSHAAVIRMAIVVVLDAPLAAFWRIDAAPLSVARLNARQGRWSFLGLG